MPFTGSIIMSSSRLTFRFILLLSILTILNMTFLGISWHKKGQDYACSLGNVIDGASLYIRQNGALSLERALPESCRRLEDKKDAVKSFNTALKNLIEFCVESSGSNNSLNSTADKVRNPAIVLFTTWTHDSSKDQIHNLTLKNWRSLSHQVEIVVFTNSSDVEKFAQSFGAQTFPILRHGGGGSPVLKWMFLTVMKKYQNSKLFGFVNSDILFTDKLIKTLETVIQIKNMSKPLFLVGRRINVKNVVPKEAKSFSEIERIAKNRGALFGANAEDYFITNKAFPWKDIIDVVVGRIAYDNWIVGHVICKLHIDVIDLSETVIAVHQTTEKGGNYEGFKSKYTHYNNALFKKLKIIPIFETGFTICSQEFTDYNLCGGVHIFKRETFWEKCKCPNTVLF